MSMPQQFSWQGHDYLHGDLLLGQFCALPGSQRACPSVLPCACTSPGYCLATCTIPRVLACRSRHHVAAQGRDDVQEEGGGRCRNIVAGANGTHKLRKEGGPLLQQLLVCKHVVTGGGNREAGG